MRLSNRTSGLDFADRGLGIELDEIYSNRAEPKHFQRNRTERRRIQPLTRMTTGRDTKFYGAVTLDQKLNLWMINDGGRQIFFGVFIFLHLLVAAFGTVNYQLNDNSANARAFFGSTFVIARAAALVLHVDVIFILLPVCRNFVSFMRRTPLGDIIPFDKNITFHKAVAWSITTGSIIHILAHLLNFYKLAVASGTNTKDRVIFFFMVNFATGPGVTGWVMTATLATMVFFAIEKRRHANFEHFWYTHHLFIVFFIGWQLHGMFCMIPADREPFCSYNNVGVFWRYWIVGGLIWIFERILREIRSRHRTYISKVIQHPSNVMELQIKKDNTTTRAGQYIFLSCPEVSYFQWHPFTLTSAPEEDYISVHIRVVGDFTSALAEAVGCDFDKKKGDKDLSGKIVGTSSNPPLNRTLPRVMVDGPFGSASEDFLNYETVLLVGAGIGVTPFASILKSIWYRMNNMNNSKRTRLSKVYFIWIIRDFGVAEWFQSLLHAIEDHDTQNRIEITIYLTTKLKEDDLHNIIVQDVGADRDAVTLLRSPTHFGRPNWNRVFTSIAEKHARTDVGVFFCGPSILSRQLKEMSNKHSDPQGTRFFFGKENF